MSSARQAMHSADDHRHVMFFQQRGAMRGIVTAVDDQLELLLRRECHGRLNLLNLFGLDDQGNFTRQNRQHRLPAGIHRPLGIGRAGLGVCPGVAERLAQLGQGLVALGQLVFLALLHPPRADRIHPRPANVHTDRRAHRQVFPRPAVELQQGRLPADQPAAGHRHRQQHAVGSADRDQFAVGIDRHLGLDIRIDRTGLRRIASSPDRADLDQTRVAVRFDEARVDVLAGHVDSLSVGRELNLLADGDDFSLVEQHGSAGDVGAIERVNRRANERDGSGLLGPRDFGRCERAGQIRKR